MQKNEIIGHVLARLTEAQAAIESSWRAPVGTSTRHFIVDALLPEAIARAAYDAFPRDGSGFHSRATFREKKRTSASLGDYPQILGDITYALQDPQVVARIGELCGMPHLEPDPDLSRGGLSMMFRGDYLNPHLDNSHDARRDRYRRLNLLYYVSPGWSSENGGNFELWDASRTNAKEIVSLQNRFVVMETNRFSWHSVNPVRSDEARCCISNYHYSTESPDGDDYYHVTSFAARPGDTVGNAIATVDNRLRQLVSSVSGRARG